MCEAAQRAKRAALARFGPASGGALSFRPFSLGEQRKGTQCAWNAPSKSFPQKERATEVALPHPAKDVLLSFYFVAAAGAAEASAFL